MAPLYKRYIPPKTTVAPASAPVIPQVKLPKVAVTDESSQKRKRERTDEEVAERKAKKLRKKGIDPDAPTTTSHQERPSGPPVAAPNEQTNADSTLDAEPVRETASDFAHIKNVKKRHKLEKEARKARKALERESDPTSAEQTIPAPVHTAQEPLVPAIDGQREDVRKAEDSFFGRNGSNIKPRASPIRHIDSVISGNDPIFTEPESTLAQDESRSGPLDTVAKNVDGVIRPKKRRHKLEPVLEPSADGVTKPAVDDDAHLQKHEGVMNKYRRSEQLANIAPEPAEAFVEEITTEPTIVDLGPLPQPEPAHTPEFIPDPSALPEWLAKPTVVSSGSAKSFEDLELDVKVVQHLARLGFANAMPVQAALIPILLTPGLLGASYLPGSESVMPDVAVGAPTGSGKTIAYLMPIIEALKRNVAHGMLRSVVVVPTRELVVQVAAVAESLARGSGIKVGMATGTGSFKDEQGKLVSSGRTYNPEDYKKQMAKAHLRNYPPAEDSDDYENYLADLEDEDPREEKRTRDTVSCLVDHVPTYRSTVDILVATPGRLLEHLSTTLGFSLAHLEWFVLDEADKLVDQQYQGFLDAIEKEFARPHTKEEQGPRERYLRSVDRWDERLERRVRKVVLSATMTTDISKLIELKLKRPQLVVVRGENDSMGPDDRVTNGQSGQNAEPLNTKSQFELPRSLREYCVHVGDGNEKPLRLLELLDQYVLGSSAATTTQDKSSESSDEAVSDSSSDSESSSSASSTDASSDEETIENPTAKAAPTELEQAIHPERAAMLERSSLNEATVRHVPSAKTATALVFTSSTEAAHRLARLLSTMRPDLASAIQTMTASDSHKTPFSKTNLNQPIIAISTDRAARGLDAIAGRPITHVLQYDVPRSATGYVHRVGRTARAGKAGEAWTLYTHSEARWFLSEISRSESISRAGSVERVKLQIEGEEGKERLATAVAQMRDEVYAQQRKRR